MTDLLCPVCGKPGGLVLLDGKPCMDCIRSRQRTATTGSRCKCGKQKQPTEVLGRPGARQWISCKRCLGTIRQVA